MLDYKRQHSPGTAVEIATNGHGTKVNDMLARFPDGVVVVNTFKTSVVQEHFMTFNVAPVDLEEYAPVDFANGCEVPEVSGIGLTKFGYYPCAVARGIDRIYGLKLGRQAMPYKRDLMTDELRQLCKYCGLFKRGNHTITDPEEMSETWKNGYADYKRNKQSLPLFGTPSQAPPLASSAVASEERATEPSTSSTVDLSTPTA